MPFSRKAVGAQLKVPQPSQHHGLTVTLTLNPASHQQGLAAVLCSEGVLAKLVRMGPDLDILEPGAASDLRLIRRFAWYRLANRILWGVWRRLPLLKRRAPLPVVALSWVADRMTSRWLPPSDIFQGLMGVCLASLHRTKSMGAITLIDNPTLHPVAWQREVLADCSSAGLRIQDCERIIPPMQIRRHEREYELCDKIIVYSSAAERTFLPFVYAGKVVVVNPGVDHQFFTPSLITPPAPTFRMCYVGRIEAAKGLHYLIEAWKRLELHDAELILAGRVLPEMTGLLSEDRPAGIKLAGILTPEKVAALYRQSHVFVFPSMNEGLSLALLEAMSAGLPVIACNDTGAEDCVTAGKDGLMVPGRDANALASALLWCYEHPNESRAMGAAARKKIEDNFTLFHYQGRLLNLYKSLIRQPTVC